MTDQNVSSLVRVLTKCAEVRDRANEAARFLGLREYFPAKPETCKEAYALLNDLRALLFDLHWKAMRREAQLASCETRRRPNLSGVSVRAAA